MDFHYINAQNIFLLNMCSAPLYPETFIWNPNSFLFFHIEILYNLCIFILYTHAEILSAHKLLYSWGKFVYSDSNFAWSSIVLISYNWLQSTHSKFIYTHYTLTYPYELSCT